MKSRIFHLGLNPPDVLIDNFYIIHCPIISINYKTNLLPHDVNKFFNKYSDILVLSQNGVKGLKSWLISNKLKLDYFSNFRFWTIGKQTHELLNKELGFKSIYPSNMTGEGVVDMLKEYNISKILLIAGQEVRPGLCTYLSKNMIAYFHFSVYINKYIKNKSFEMHYKNISCEYLVFTSPSTVNSFLHINKIDDLSAINSKIVSIGPTTSKTIIDNAGLIFFESNYQNINKLYSNLNERLKQ